MIETSRGGLFAPFDRRAAQRLIGAPLPDGAEDVRFVRWQPSGDLAYHEALIRFACSKEDYLALVRARGLTLFADSGPDVHLPIPWRPAPEMNDPEWWTPSSETPPDAAGGLVGSDGSIAAKWEAGHAYVMVTDTGHRRPA